MSWIFIWKTLLDMALANELCVNSRGRVLHKSIKALGGIRQGEAVDPDQQSDQETELNGSDFWSIKKIWKSMNHPSFCWWFLTMGKCLYCSDMCTIFWRHKLGTHFIATSLFNILAMGNYLIYTLFSRNQNRLNFISRSLVWTPAEKIVYKKEILCILVILILLKSDKFPRSYSYA